VSLQLRIFENACGYVSLRFGLAARKEGALLAEIGDVANHCTVTVL
jgi:hypothetical protein